MSCAKGMRACRFSCLHREMVNDYRVERERQETAIENGEWRTRRADGEVMAGQEPLITFKRWMEGRRGASREEAS